MFERSCIPVSLLSNLEDQRHPQAQMKVNVTVKMSSLLSALQKSGGQVRSVTSQAALIKTSLGVLGKEAELNNRLQMNEAQKKYDEEYQKILFLKSSLHELYKIDPVETRFPKMRKYPQKSKTLNFNNFMRMFSLRIFLFNGCHGNTDQT